jgi:hypothetical protein
MAGDDSMRSLVGKKLSKRSVQVEKPISTLYFLRRGVRFHSLKCDLVLSLQQQVLVPHRSL